MRKMYSLEEMITTFIRHAEESESMKIDFLKSFVENNPGEEIPEDMKSDFNFPMALLSICNEIALLKEYHNTNVLLKTKK